MATYQVEESAVIPAPADRVYELIADYHEGHQAILPRRYFDSMEVVEGGQGEGTVVHVEMTVFGVHQTFHLTVSEPEPGRVLLEEDPAAGVSTTFTVVPVEGGAHTRVTIASTARTSPGLRGLFEKLFTPAITRRIYREELAQLAAVAAADAADASIGATTP